MIELSQEWIDIHRKLFKENYVNNKVTVYNWEDFEKYVDDVLHCSNDLEPDVAIIEIYTSPGHPVLSEEHLNRENVIALDFEDMPEDVDFPDSKYHPLNPTINYAQAEELVRFIDKWSEREYSFVIHCGAGVSRSQQVAEYIMMATHSRYSYDEMSSHSHHFFNTIVLSRLLEVKHRILPDFNNKDGRMVYDGTLDKWVERSRPFSQL